jgi:hypothetical protein
MSDWSGPDENCVKCRVFSSVAILSAAVYIFRDRRRFPVNSQNRLFSLVVSSLLVLCGTGTLLMPRKKPQKELDDWIWEDAP